MPHPILKIFSPVGKALRQWVLFPFLFPLFFVLHVAGYYFGSIPASDVGRISAVWTLLSLLAYGLLRPLLRNRMRAAVATLLLTILVGCWYKILNPLLAAFHTGENYKRLPWTFLGFLALIAALSYGAGKLREQAAGMLRYYLNTLFLLFIVAELGLMGFYALQQRPGPFARNPTEQAIDASARPGGNIYLLLFDEYASTEILKQKWGISNGAADSFLKSRGFFVNAHSRSNYCWTEFSMASLLHMDYFRRFHSAHNLVGRQDMQRAITAIENPRVVEVLRAAGYAIRPYSIFQVDSQAPEYIPELRINKGRLITTATLFHAISLNYLPYLIHRAQIKSDPNYHFPPFYRMNEYNEEGVRWVMREAAQQEGKPRFVYAHFFMPHSTYYYDSSGRLMPMERIKQIPTEAEPRYYGYNLRHANEKMRLMVDRIQQYDPSACILVLGDHGYRQNLYEDDRYPEYFHNMCAIYFPDKDYRSLPDSFTNVNVFRLVLNKVCGTHYPLLPDHSCPLTLAP